MAITTEILGGAVQLTGIPAWVKVSGGVAPVGAIDYKYLLKVIDVDGKLLAEPVPDAIAPDASGEAMFDISGRVNQPVTAVFEYPDANPFVEYPTQAFSIKVQVGEGYITAAGVVTEVWGAQSAAFQMLKGGVSQRQIAAWYAAGTNFYNTYIAAGKFLTHRPWGDFVHPDQPVKLWFIPAAGIAAKYKIKAVFDDASEQEFSADINLDNTKLYEFSCNPKKRGIDVEPAGKKVSYFDVWLEPAAGGAAISDVRRFTYDWTYYERPFYILFANSIGGVDDVLLSGRAIEKFKLESNVIQKNPLRDAPVQEPVLITPESSGQNAWTINTGTKTPSQMLHLRDLLVSRQKWLVYPNNAVTAYTVIPVIVTNSDSELIKRTENMQDIDLSIEEAEKSQYSFDNRLF